MIAFLENNLVHFYLGFMLIVFGAILWGIRRVTRRGRIVRGEGV